MGFPVSGPEVVAFLEWLGQPSPHNFRRWFENYRSDDSLRVFI